VAAGILREAAIPAAVTATVKTSFPHQESISFFPWARSQSAETGPFFCGFGLTLGDFRWWGLPCRARVCVDAGQPWRGRETLGELLGLGFGPRPHGFSMLGPRSFHVESVLSMPPTLSRLPRCSGWVAFNNFPAKSNSNGVPALGSSDFSFLNTCHYNRISFDVYY
jgi:hypothetical protein